MFALLGTVFWSRRMALRGCVGFPAAWWETILARRAFHSSLEPGRVSYPSSSNHLNSHFQTLPPCICASPARRVSTTAALSLHLSHPLAVRGPIRVARSNRPRPEEQVSGDIPVIRVPQRMAARLQKALNVKEVRDEDVLRYKQVNSNRPLVIEAKRPEFNYRLGAPQEQLAKKSFKVRTKNAHRFLTLKLASQSWVKPRSVGDWFKIRGNSSGLHPALKDSMMDSVPGFEKFHLHPQLQQTLKEMDLTMCSAIQNAAIPVILQGESVICAAETGSGKTVAYLVPLINRLMMEAAEEKSDDSPRTANAPKCMIVVPNRELAQQVHEVAEDLVTNSPRPINIVNLIGGERTQLKLKKPHHELVDVLISTPGVLLKLLERGIYTLSNTQSMVLDEADTLLDDSFSQLSRGFLTQLNFSPPVVMNEDGAAAGSPVAQLILAGATIPRGLDVILRGVIPPTLLQTVRTPFLHKVQPHVTQTFMRVREAEKPGMIVKMVREDQQKQKATLIFTNYSDTANWLSKFLTESGLTTDTIFGNMKQRSRRGRYKNFQQGAVTCMVCTDVASRGLDTLFVEHVINYDFPRVVSDYIHRCGRVGRLGGTGKGLVTSLVAHKWEVEPVQRIEESVRMTSQIHNVNANITRLINSQYGVDPLPDVNPQFKGPIQFEEEEEPDDGRGIQVEPRW